MIVRKISALLLMLICSVEVFSQGCSDAGFCTMGAMKPDQPFNKKIPIRLRSMEVSFYRGTTTTSPIVYVATADLNFSVLDSKTSFQVKLPFQAVKGNFGSTGGVSDISLCLTRNIFSSEKFDINISIGSKIPTNDSNKKNEENGLAYPMYYQTSLGTYDAIAGISLMNRNWLFATGIQHPFNQNKNQFTWADWDPVYRDGQSPDYVRTYAQCYELKRGTDVMLRAERNFRFSRLNASLGVLSIYRINKDEITVDPTGTAERVKPDGTTGMALSGIATLGYSFNVRSGIRILYGKKFMDRERNPDGLTRHDVSTISYYFRF
jgi:hypothetical protein